jgi:hypothetical protein
MPLDENDKRRLVLKLISQLHCLECGELYERQDFSMVHRWDDVWLLSSHCRACGEIGHVVIFMRLDADPDFATDLTPEEIESAEEWQPITADDVLDVHVLLEDFEGDFEELLTG